LPDREIAAAIVASDVNGVAAAFDRYAQELYVYSRSRLAVPAEAAGAVQDTFLVAWSEVRRLHQPGRLRPWLFAVARNECHRLLRTGMRAAPAGAMDDTVQLATLTEQAELRAMVAAALAGLDPMEREIGELNLRHGLRGADLAAVLGVPAKQADALAARARADLESSLRTPPTVGSTRGHVGSNRSSRPARLAAASISAKAASRSTSSPTLAASTSRSASRTRTASASSAFVTRAPGSRSSRWHSHRESSRGVLSSSATGRSSWELTKSWTSSVFTTHLA